MTILRSESTRSNSLPPEIDDYYLEKVCPKKNNNNENYQSSTQLYTDKLAETIAHKCSQSISSSLATDDSGFGNLVSHRDISDLPSVSSGMSKDEFLVAMSEDLSDWLVRLYPDRCSGLTFENFFEALSTGVILCEHGKNLHMKLCEYHRENEGNFKNFKTAGTLLSLPKRPPSYSSRNIPETSQITSSLFLSSTAMFVSRDNLSNFIAWAKELGLGGSILFETEDLIGKKNLRNFVLCLMEIARIGGKFGFLIPEIIHLEAEIDGEENHLFNRDLNEQQLCDREPSHLPPPKKQATISSKYMNVFSETKPGSAKNKIDSRPDFDLKSLDEIVRDVLSKCTCEKMFPMIRLSEGRYRYGNKSQLIFVRILRNHVMVRVGGGWDTLNDFLNKHDECRKGNKNTRNENTFTTNEATVTEQTITVKSLTEKMKVRSQSVSRNSPSQERNRPLIKNRKTNQNKSTSVCSSTRNSQVKKTSKPDPETKTKIPIPRRRITQPTDYQKC